MKINDAVQLYIELRDRKAAIKAEADAKIATVQEKMDILEVKLLQAFERAGLDSVKTPAGTAYTSTRTSASVADRESFLAFVRAREEWSLMDIRASKTAIEQYQAANEELPPGINLRTERVVNVRRTA